MSSPQLQPGDVLLYNRSSFFNWLIRIKTWSRISHVEIVMRAVTETSAPIVVASRNGIGVGRYLFDPSGLALVMRPRGEFNVKAADRWVDTVDGQGYDYLGLLNFFYAQHVGKNNNRQFCSELVTRVLRNGGLWIFGEADADTIAPRDFEIADGLDIVWRSDAEWARFRNKGAV